MNIWWAVKSGKILLPFSIRTTRQQAIKNYTAEVVPCPHIVSEAWAERQAVGDTVVRVRVEEIE